MEKKQIFILTRIIVAAVLLGVSFFHIGTIATIVLCAVAYAIVGYDVLWQAAKNIIHGKVFDELVIPLAGTFKPSVEVVVADIRKQLDIHGDTVLPVNKKSEYANPCHSNENDE